ncbi:MAG: hypothetical protein OEO20_01850 [Gemmatimonadota bacterium]|nr:hypothetical protein [Gemmatimonadota bacterium]MDH3369664.1 hypothetical protein [Gemmatimonadota bacterium]MDH3477030.1 hypothetical protein [Gemmatimonadota bacterium]MDH3570635.1 hypothetical protein [Gemmatimonadota bacterium]MDH5551654.1 hypothetical protein [Gemmatimonadota bacterium]
MKAPWLVAAAILALATPYPVAAQGPSASKLPDLSGTWQADSPDGPITVIVRPDSSASFGDEIVRWRIASDTVYLAIGGEWLAYNFSLRNGTLTLSGGDLEEPIALARIGPPTPRPEGTAVPPVPGTPPAAAGGVLAGS